MNYEGTVYRPPSEAKSLIIQITVGCSHNKCTFCSMYKDKTFRIRNIKEIIKDLYSARRTYSNVERIFLADGNGLTLKTEHLQLILLKIKKLFPECKRIGIYSAPKDIARKSLNDLRKLKNLGLKIIYLGVESGSSDILKTIKKDVTSNEIIDAAKKITDSEIKLSITLISGLGGKKHWKKHALESAKLINKINPDYLALLTLLIQPGTELHQEILDNKFKLLSPKEVIKETKEMISNLHIENCIFRSNHASNYIPLAGTLSKDKNKLLKNIDYALSQEYSYREEYFRTL